MARTNKRLDAVRLADKVHWEGGVISALEYGIRSDEIDDPELANIWRHMEELYDQLRPSVVVADRLLRAARRSSRPVSEPRAA